jgi:thioredoxin-dependent peroxiredoxin
VRELREFRVNHPPYAAAGITVAGVSFDSPELNRKWVERLKLPFELLTDADRVAGNAFGVITRLGIAGWKLELMQRATALIAPDGHVAAMWTRVKIRGHAIEVLQAAKALGGPPSTPDSSPAST